jgi:tRNA 2-thiouridine synthesizing protein A
MEQIDARGFGCPIPVIKTKKALDAQPGKPLTVLVDAAVAVENVMRLALSRDCKVDVENLDGGDFKLVLTPK